jgi:hypothetical protein
MSDELLRDMLRARMVALASVHDTTPEASVLGQAIAALDEVERKEIAARPDPKTCMHQVELPLGETSATCKRCKTTGHVGNWLTIITTQRDDARSLASYYKEIVEGKRR